MVKILQVCSGIGRKLACMLKLPKSIKKEAIRNINYVITSYLVIRLGLEPKTPTLKVLCSTC